MSIFLASADRASSPALPHAPSAEVTYESLMLQWARVSSPTHRCIVAQARQPPRVLPPGPVWTIGVEGAGHHMIEEMNHSLCGQHVRGGLRRRCGGQMSFPSLFAWRKSATISPSSTAVQTVDDRSQQRTRPPPMMTCASFLTPSNSKILFLLRDPVDAAISALGRLASWSKRPTLA